MKETPKAIAGLVLGAWLASCGGGTLGGSGGAVGTLPVGAGGVSGDGRPTTGAAGAGQGIAGFGGDIVGPGGNIGGVAGRGGFSSPGGRGGMGGTAPICPPVDPPVCGSFCGNGKIDTCAVIVAAGCPLQRATELCDGDDFGTDSCAARGYGSGKLTCNSYCTPAEDQCSPCLPPSALVASCGPGPSLTRYFGMYDMAATDTEIAVATTAYNDIDSTMSIGFMRLARDLSVTSSATLGEPTYYIWGAAVAPLPSGWVVGVCAASEIYFHTLDADGREIARVQIANASDPSFGCMASVPVLAARPDGGPLMLWQTETGVGMAVIAADGQSVSAPLTIVGDLANSWEYISAAWVGAEFSVAVPIEPQTGSGVYALRLLRVSSDGTPRFVGDFLAGEIEGTTSMATGADARDVRVVYNAAVPGSAPPYDYGVFWWRYDPSAPTSSVLLGVYPDAYGHAPAVAFGDDTVVLVSSALSDALAVVRVGPDGRIVAPPRQIARTPYSGVGLGTMVRRGPEVVVGFVDEQGRLNLARVTP